MIKERLIWFWLYENHFSGFHRFETCLSQIIHQTQYSPSLQVYFHHMMAVMAPAYDCSKWLYCTNGVLWLLCDVSDSIFDTFPPSQVMRVERRSLLFRDILWRMTAGLCWAPNILETATHTEAPRTHWTSRLKGRFHWNTTPTPTQYLPVLCLHAV